MRPSLRPTLVVVVAVCAACGDTEDGLTQRPREIEQSSTASSMPERITALDTGTARERVLPAEDSEDLVLAVMGEMPTDVKEREAHVASLLRRIDRRGASRALADQEHAGFALFLLAVDSQESAAQERVARYSETETAAGHFGAWILYVRGALAAESRRPEARALLAAAKEQWGHAESAQIPTNHLRRVDLVQNAVPIARTLSFGEDRIDLSKGRIFLFFSMVNCSPCRVAYECIREEGIPTGWEAVFIVKGEENATPPKDDPAFPHRNVTGAEVMTLLREFGVDQFPYWYVLREGRVTYAGNDWSAALREMR